MSGERKQHRLAVEYYRGIKVYFVTITVADRRLVFVADALVSSHLDTLGRAASKHVLDIIAYCYMPDHLHLLVAGREQASDLIALIKDYKQVTGFYYKKQTGHALWQKSFYDHVLRKDEAIHEVAQYILANPVRKKMVGRPADYAYAGSLVYGRAIFDGLM